MSYRNAKKKKFISVFIVAVVIFIAACFAMPFLGEAEGYRTITVFEVSGTVGVVKDGIEYEAYPGMLLQEGHVIVTSENSYARLVLDDDKYVKVESGSRLEFETLGLLGSGKTKLKLDRGALTTEIVNPLGEDEEYVVNTPNAILAVRGTFFRVDLKVTENGEIDTNVYTYGGKVASNRVLPTGEKVEEEVIVDAGYMTAIRMDTVDTIYIVGATDSATGVPVEEERKNTVPIYLADIPDDDLVDIYFASTNGHEMFISTEEIKETIDTREILVEEHKSVYERADEVKIQLQEETTTAANASTALIPDDRGDVIEDREVVAEDSDEPQVEEVVEDVEIEEDIVVEEEIVAEEVVQETPAIVETHTHSYTSQITTSATCEDNGVKTYSCTCGDSYTETVSAKGHSEVTEYVDGTASADGMIRVYCENCNETYEEETLFSIPLHFPDEGFAQYVRDNYNNDSYTNSLSGEELTALEASTTISLPGTVSQDGGVTSLKGIEYFKSLTSLDCGYNAGIEELDMSSCTGLTSLSVSGATGLQNLTLDGCTGLTTLDVSANSLLESFVCVNTGLTKIDLSNKTALGEVTITDSSKLKNINVSGCTNLEDSAINFTNLPAITVITATDATAIDSMDFSGFPELLYLYLNNTGITTLDLASNTKLLELNVENTGIRELDLTANTKLNTLKVTNAPLEKLIIYSNSLYNLDLSTQGTTLTYLDIKYGSGLGSLDLTANTELTYLAGNTLGISSLDLTKNTKLKTVQINVANQLDTLNVSGNSSIETFTLTETILTSANFDGCTALKSLNVSVSNITSLSLTGCDNLEDLTIAYTSLDALPIPNPEKIKKLNLNYCKAFTSLDLTAYTQLSELWICNCSNLLTIDTGGRYSNGDISVQYENTDLYLEIDGIAVNNY